MGYVYFIISSPTLKIQFEKYAISFLSSLIRPQCRSTFFVKFVQVAYIICIDYIVYNVISSRSRYNRKNLSKITTKYYNLSTKNLIRIGISTHHILQSSVNCFRSMFLCHWCLIPNDQLCLPKKLCIIFIVINLAS